MNFNYIRPLRLDAALGASEQRSEAYIKYDERAAQLATTGSAKSSGRVVGSAGKQATAPQRSE